VRPARLAALLDRTDPDRQETCREDLLRHSAQLPEGFLVLPRARRARQGVGETWKTSPRLGTWSERFRRRDFGHLDVEMTFDDPQMYTKPFTIKIPHNLMADADIFEDSCDNEKDRAHLGKK
jgi:hypothetical protein